ncbi:MAG: alkaline phosphatase family protein [Verrucomicrobiae bacterium]|nr:alkaline phosphatase family protein [Verrucomicrobiae bacterium]
MKPTKLSPRRHHCRSWLWLILLGLGIGISNSVHGAPDTNRHVILITIDGLAASYLSDPRAPLPTLRELAAHGAAAETMHVSTPAVTWPNHTTLVTGVSPRQHSVLFNGRLTRGASGAAVDLKGTYDKRDLVAAPTVYDLLHGLGLRTAGINWPCTRNSGTLDDDFPDVPDAVDFTTPRLREELIQAGWLTSPDNEAFRSHGIAVMDEIWTGAAVHLFRTRPPHFLLFHLLTTDSVQHQYGPQSTAAYAALGLADARVAELLRAVDAAGLRSQTTVLITSDHGFIRPTKRIRPNVLFRKAGLFEAAPQRRAQSVAEGGTAFVYLTHPETRTEDRAKVIELLREHEGVAAVLEPESFAKLGLPDPAQNPQMCDLLLAAEDGYAFVNDASGNDSLVELKTPAGTHGYLASEPKMDGVFIAAGAGIRPGVKLKRVENVDVAPTIAALFGQTLNGVEGQVLRQILLESK